MSPTTRCRRFRPPARRAASSQTSDAVSRVIERAAIERGAITQVVLAADPDGKIGAAATQAARDTDARVVQMQESFAATAFAKRPELAGPVNQLARRLS